MNRPRLLSLLCFTALTLTACGTSEGNAQRQAQPLSSDDLWQPACDKYPVEFTPGPKREQNARDYLDLHFPTAQLQWSSARGTLQSVFGLSMTIDGCGSGDDAYELAAKLAAQHGDLFQFDGAEWAADGVLDCSLLTGGTQFLGFNRTTLAGLPMQKDRLTFFAHRNGKDLVLTGAAGFYLPPAPPDLALALSGCTSRGGDELQKAGLNAKYPFETFFWCAPTGSGVYAPNLIDEVELQGGPFWSYDETPGVALRLRHAAALRVHEDNHTPQLLASNANCPDWQNQPQVGFTIGLDAVLAEVESTMPGVGCIVCLTP